MDGREETPPVCSEEGIEVILDEVSSYSAAEEENIIFHLESSSDQLSPLPESDAPFEEYTPAADDEIPPESDFDPSKDENHSEIHLRHRKAHADLDNLRVEIPAQPSSAADSSPSPSADSPSASPPPIEPNSRLPWGMIVAGGIILSTNTGVRQSFPLFFSPLTTSLGWTRSTFSLAIAIQNLCWGLTQPYFGVLSDKYGPAMVLVFAATLFIFGIALMAAAQSVSLVGFHIGCGPLVGLALSASSYSVVLTAIAKQVEQPHRRPVALSVCTALGSFGQLIFPLISQAIISTSGWSSALAFCSAISAVIFVTAFWFREQKSADTGGKRLWIKPQARKIGSIEMAPIPSTPNPSPSPFIPSASSSSSTPSPLLPESSSASSDSPAPIIISSTPVADIQHEQTLFAALKEAMHNPSYICLNLGFFVCGFHIVFINTHLPIFLTSHGMASFVAATTLAFIGSFNLIGTLAWGWLAARTALSSLRRVLLSSMYFLRLIAMVGFITSPVTAASALIFSAAMGLLWLSTVPLTSSICSIIFGPKWGSTLFGFVFLSHQVGGFLGSWLGGYIFDIYGSYDVAWYICVALAAMATLIQLPISERPIPRDAKPLTE